MSLTTIPLVMSASGPVPTSPVALLQALTDLVAATNPGYTNNLPGTLIEDISSTCVGALSTIDSYRVETVNDVTPYGANAFILAQLGVQSGIAQGTPTNTSVNVVFSGTAGYVIAPGFLVSDGTYQYVIQSGGVIQTSGTTSQLYAVANQAGTWAVPSGSVNQVVTSVASGYALTVTNPEAGTPSTGSESVQSYRSRVLQAQQITSQGTANYITTLLQNTPGVTPRLVKVVQAIGGWEVICGGGDTYAVAYAIYQGTLDLSTIVGSQTTARNVTASIIEGPNTYSVVYVNPPQQVVTVSAVWNTNLPNFTAGAQVNQLAAPALVSYINSIIVGEPMNLLEMTNAFQVAVESVLSPSNLSALTFTVTINGTVVSPEAGTSLIASDSESYFEVSASGVTVTQG